MNPRRYQPSGLGPFLCDAELTVTTLDSPPMTPPIQPTKPGVAAPINIQQTFAAAGTLANAIVNGWQPTPQEATEIFTAMLLMKNALKSIGIDMTKEDKFLTLKDAEEKMRAAINRQVAAVDEPTTLSAIAAIAADTVNSSPALRKLANDVLGVNKQIKSLAADIGLKFEEKPKDTDWSKAPTPAEKNEALAALGLTPRGEG